MRTWLAGHGTGKAVPCVTIVVLMWGLKRYYAGAAVDDLHWILDPTARLATALSGVTFAWQSGEGYLSRERLFVIAKACAGINFMIAAFGMVAWVLRRRVTSWISGVSVIALSAITSYAAAVIVNAVRITVAIRLADRGFRVRWMTAAQLHRTEGILFYFAGLVLLHGLVSRMAQSRARFPRLATPLFWYYAIAIGVPLANGAARQGAVFARHTLFVMILPLALVAVAGGCRASFRLWHVLPALTNHPRNDDGEQEHDPGDEHPETDRGVAADRHALASPARFPIRSCPTGPAPLVGRLTAHGA